MHLHGVTTIAILYGFSLALVKSMHYRNPSNEKSDAIESAFLSRYAAEREKRAISMHVRGLAALRKLLFGSESVPLKSQVYRRYAKVGDFETALKEFYSVKPRNVKERKSYSLRVVAKSDSGRILSGDVGNRRLLLKEVGENGRPTLEVIETKLEPGPYIDQIIYKRLNE